MSEIKEKTSVVPAQQSGASKDIEHTEVALDENDARKLFMIARNRLMNVNEWDHYAEGLSATFRLADAGGNEVSRTAEKDDHFKISIPAPGPTESRGYDWVRIENIEDVSDPNGTHEYLAIRVRPTADPTQKVENISHFLNGEATSSFVVERDGKKVKASVFGRNEVPNTETDRLVDKVRNAVVGATAIAGLANIQWKKLVKGLIKPA